MNKSVEIARTYFSPVHNYFWKWADNGEVIEWQDGMTLCYREDLLQILKSMSSQGLPSLGSILLTMAACQKLWHGAEFSRRKLIKILDTFVLAEYIKETAFSKIDQTIKVLEMVHALPEHLRVGDNRFHLFHELFKYVPKVLDEPKAKAILAMIDDGSLDEVLFASNEAPIIWETLQKELQIFVRLHQYFESSNQLEMLLQAGIKEIPNSKELEIPPPDFGDLMEELANDSRTLGISRLAKRLNAAFNIPMHANGSSDQPLGGISDISNRGNFDRLLLSELAYDDLMLTARLVNKEALFLRREEPPAKQQHERNILIDTTLKMWGLPKVFALAAALSCTEDRRQDLSIAAFALGREAYEAINIQTRIGIIDSQSKMDVHVHPGLAIERFFGQEAIKSQQENIFITEESVFLDKGFQRHFSQFRNQLHYIILLQRNGQLQLFQLNNGHRKCLKTVQVDLAEILFAPKEADKNYVGDDLPITIRANYVPMYLPTTSMQISGATCHYLEEEGVIGIDEMKRLLYWPEKGGCIQLLDVIEGDTWLFDREKKGTIYIIGYKRHTSQLAVYEVDLDSTLVQTTDYSTKFAPILDVIFEDDRLLVKTEKDYIAIDYKTHYQIIPIEGRGIEAKYRSIKLNDPKNDRSIKLKKVKRHINTGYSVRKRVRKIGITEGKQLTLDQTVLKLKNNRLIWEKNQYGERVLASAEPSRSPSYPLKNRQMPFVMHEWADGSLAIIDPRGLIHLRSSDSTIPEITIATILGKTTVCYVDDSSTVCGNTRFIRDHSQIMDTQQFYNTYIQPFIDVVIQQNT